MTTQPDGAADESACAGHCAHGTPDRLILVDSGRRLAGLINACRYAELLGVGDLDPTRRPISLLR